jgi:O-antigen ligase
MSAVRMRGTALVVLTCLALLSVGVGRAIVETQAIRASPGVILLAAAIVIAATAVMLAGPTPCIAAIVILTVLRPSPAVSLGGGVDLFAADAFFAALVCWWFLGAAGARSAERGARTQLRAGPVLVLLGYIGLNLLYVAAIDPGRLSVAFVSWLRLLETATVGWLAAAFLRTRRDVNVVLGGLALAGAIALALALAGGAGDANGGVLGARGGSFINANTLGLVSGLLVVIGTFGALGPSLVYRVPLVICGVTGIVQSQSVGSIAGTSVAIMLGLAFMVDPPKRILGATALRAAIALVIGLAVAYGVAAAVRPENLPTSQHFEDSSAGQRAVLGAAGLELAERHPLIGVGWRRSEEPAVIGDPGVNAELRARFPSTRADFFPDVMPGSVHNAYIQVAADLGLLGLGLLAFVFVSVGRQIRRILAGVKRRGPTWTQLWSLTWGLVLVVVWWNDNPIFGGQPETVIPAVFLGAIAGLSRALPAGEPAAPTQVDLPARPRGLRSWSPRPSDDLLAGVVGDNGRQRREHPPGRDQRPR